MVVGCQEDDVPTVRAYHSATVGKVLMYTHGHERWRRATRVYKLHRDHTATGGRCSMSEGIEEMAVPCCLLSSSVRRGTGGGEYARPSGNHWRARKEWCAWLRIFLFNLYISFIYLIRLRKGSLEGNASVERAGLPCLGGWVVLSWSSWTTRYLHLISYCSLQVN